MLQQEGSVENDVEFTVGADPRSVGAVPRCVEIVDADRRFQGCAGERAGR